jgi:hypothetical protein
MRLGAKGGRIRDMDGSGGGKPFDLLTCRLFGIGTEVGDGY